LRDAEAGTRLYAPLGVGNHVDHQLVRRAAIAVWPGPLWFYQDFPYAAVPGALAAALCAARAGAGGGESVGPAELPVAARAVALRREDVRARVRAVTCYRSQIAVLFGSPYAMARAIWRDARSGAALAPDSEPGASPPSARGAEGHARDSRLELAETFWFAR
jgi:hypothetical protein